MSWQEYAADVSNIFVRHKARRLGASLRTLMREGYGQWAGNWILGKVSIQDCFMYLIFANSARESLTHACTVTRHVSSRCS